MNATRFALPPIPQPHYRFSNVPAAARDLSGSTVTCVNDRQVWQACMGEMLLVCKEAIRRRRRRQQQITSSCEQSPQEASTSKGEQQQPEQDDRKPAATAAASATTTTTTTTSSGGGSGGCSGGSKPLSLEYIADRLDVDDPMWGLIVRTRNTENMLQGFITVTTFTNYNRTFCWDSCHACSFQETHEEEYTHKSNYNNGDIGDDTTHGTSNSTSSNKNNNVDNNNDPYDMANRKVDSDGSLAREMNATVRAGDIWNEGIVWPRIAEIGLLGGLGCGRTLVKLVIEQLECMKPSARANYDYVVLQATDNSIPFYESLGFVRVGAVMQQENIGSDENDESNDGNDFQDNSNNSDGRSDSEAEEVVAEPLTSDDSNDAQQAHITEALATPCARVSSKTIQYTTTKPGETPTQIAKKLLVNVHDIIFLNQYLYPELVPSSKTRVGTILLIPNEEVVEPSPPPPPPQLGDDQKLQQQQQQQQPVWYIAKENETPRSIARKLGLDCIELVNANKSRLPGLLSSSRLKDGTRVKISNFDSTTDNLYKPYAHWTFPDDKFEEGEPSYMMALKLNRCNNNSSSAKMRNKERPFAESLAVPVVDYEPTSSNNETVDAALLSSTAANDPPHESMAAVAAAAAAVVAPRQGRASRRRWQSHQDAESHGSISTGSSNTQGSHSTTTISTATSNVDNDDDDDDDIPVKPAPKPPLKPAFVHPYRLFVADFKRDHADLLYKKHVGEISTITGDAWRQLSPREKQRYDQRIAAFKHQYESALQSYREQMASIRRAKEQRRLKKLGLLQAATCATTAAAAAASAAPQPQPPLSFQQQSASSSSINLFNKVVKIKPECSHITEGSLHLYEYWYVLTFIPDLQWCHLAPLYQVGRVFGDDKTNSKGRPIWKLVDEELGEEVDISSSLVIPVKAKSMKRTLDADKEEWDVIGTPLSLTAPAYSRSNSLGSGFNSSQMQSVSRRGSFGDSTCDGSLVAATSTTAGTSTSRKRKRSSFASEGTSPSSIQQQPGFAMAVMPRTGKRVKVWIKIGPGQRGRPRGSKNKKPKAVPNHVVTTGQKKAPPSYSYNDNDNISSNNNNNEGDYKKDKNNNKNGRPSHLPSKRNNSRVKVVMPPTDGMSFLEHASSPKKQQQQNKQTKSKRPSGKGRSAAAALPTHSAVKPASRKARNAAPAANSRADHVEESKAASVAPQNFPVDSVVVVQARAWPGCNKPGGVARVTRVQQAADSTLYDVKYVLGGREKGIDGVFLSCHDEKNSSSNNITRALLKSEPAVDTQSSAVEKQPGSQRTSLKSTSLVEGQSASSSLPIVNDPESKISAVFPVGAVVVVEARRWPGCNKRGGVACVTRVEQGKSVLYDVKYVLGGSEKGVEEAFMSWHDDKVARPVPRSEMVPGKRASTREKQQHSRKVASHESTTTQPTKDKLSSPSSLAKRPASHAAASDDDAIASGGENNSQPERTSSRLQTKRHTTLALLDDGTRGRGTPRSKSVRTRSSMEASSSILTEVAPHSNKRPKKRVRREDGTFLPSPTNSRRVRDPLELLMP